MFFNAYKTAVNRTKEILLAEESVYFERNNKSALSSVTQTLSVAKQPFGHMKVFSQDENLLRSIAYQLIAKQYGELDTCTIQNGFLNLTYSAEYLSLLLNRFDDALPEPRLNWDLPEDDWFSPLPYAVARLSGFCHCCCIANINATVFCPGNMLIRDCVWSLFCLHDFLQKPSIGTKAQKHASFLLDLIDSQEKYQISKTDLYGIASASFKALNIISST